MYKWPLILFLAWLFMISVSSFVSLGDQSPIEPATLNTDNATDSKGAIKPEWAQAVRDRRFRIAPIDGVELCEPEPELSSVLLPHHEAYQGQVCKLAVVAMPDAYCYGVLLVSTNTKWLKVKYGSPVTILSINAFVKR